MATGARKEMELLCRGASAASQEEDHDCTDVQKWGGRGISVRKGWERTCNAIGVKYPSRTETRTNQKNIHNKRGGRGDKKPVGEKKIEITLECG